MSAVRGATKDPGVAPRGQIALAALAPDPNPRGVIDTRNATARLTGIGTALPPNRASQAEITRFLSRVARAQPDADPRLPRYVDALAGRSGIDARYSVLADYTREDPRDFEFYPQAWSLEPFPSTADRMAEYREHAVPLAEAAARAALADAGTEPGAITHLVMTTCTGFFAPGPDVALVDRLGLRPEAQRTQIGFMGCYAGVTGLRTAQQIVLSDPGARVLLVSVELCSLHYQRTPDVETLVCNLLFGDGASAAVIDAAGEGPTLLAARSHLARDTREQMGWQVGDHGFVMHLGEEVPAALKESSGPFVDALCAQAGFRVEDVTGWALHPGGRRIVEAIGSRFELAPEMLAPALGVLRRVGNLSSATVLFVLQDLLRGGWRGPGLALAFGPGLTMEGVALRA